MPTTDPVAADVRRALEVLGDRAQPPPAFERLAAGASPAAAPAHRPPRRWVVAAGLAAAIAVVGGGVAFLARDDEAPEDVRVGTTPPDAPPPAPGWTRLPDPPLSPRNSTTAVWTGAEVVVVGGWEFTCPAGASCEPAGDEPAFADGAALDLATRTWRPIAPAPVGFTTTPAVAVGGDAYFFGEPGLLRYRPDADAWDVMPLPPGPHGAALGAAGGNLVLASGSDEGGEEVPDWILDPATGAWSALPDDPLPPSYDRSLIWDGQGFLVFAKAIPPPGDSALSPIAGARLDPATEEWTLLPPSGTSGYQAWLVDGVVVVNPHFGVDAGGGIFDPTSGTWSPLPSPPADWSGDMAGVLGTASAVFGDSGSVVLDTTSSTWIEIPDPAPDAAFRGQPAAIGRDLFLMGAGTEAPLRVDAWLWIAPPPG